MTTPKEKLGIEGLDEAIKQSLISLTSTNQDLAKIMTDIKNDSEALLFTCLSSIANDQNYEWLKDFVVQWCLFKMSSKRKREAGIIDVLKARLVGEDETRKGPIKKLKEVLTG